MKNSTLADKSYTVFSPVVQYAFRCLVSLMVPMNASWTFMSFKLMYLRMGNNFIKV
jgi:hypothetical protein